MKKKSTFQFLLAIAFAMLTSSFLSAQPTFINKIPIPPLVDVSTGMVQLEIKSQMHSFNPGNPADLSLNNVPGWSFNVAGSNANTYLGPTLKWKKGQAVNMQITNKLTEATSVHWQGANVPATMDGGPLQSIMPNQTWSVNFTNSEPASTMWYHPHAYTGNFPHQLMGLAGMVISEDPTDPLYAKLPRNYGSNDIPILIGDLATVQNGPAYAIVDTDAPRKTNIVNGVHNPYYNVPPEIVRLRIVNTSARKSINLALSDSYNSTAPSSFVDMKVIATDGGYLTSPKSLKYLLLGPGERTEILVDFSWWPDGDSIYLRNMKTLMPGDIVGSPNGSGADITEGNAFLAFRVDDSLFPPNPIFIIPATLLANQWEGYGLQDPFNVDRIRTLNIHGSVANGFTLNGNMYNPQAVNDTICEGAKETWTIHNQTAVSHPFHIQKVTFRVLQIDSMGTILDLDARGLNGPKDELLIRPNWKLQLLAKFDKHPTNITAAGSHTFYSHFQPFVTNGNEPMLQFVNTEDPHCDPSVGLLGDACADANNINLLFGQAQNVPQTSSLWDNTGYNNTGDPSTGFECFADGPSLEHTIWYSFTGDGNTYRIRSVECNATNYNDDPQVAIYSGSCGSLTPVACNEDEDFDNDIYNIQVDVMTQVGVSYWMMVDGWSSIVGQFCLEVTNLGSSAVTEIGKTDISVFPNPTTGLVSIGNINADRVEVFDYTGRLFLQVQQPGSSIDLSAAPAGIYFLKLYAGDVAYSARVVKE